MLHWKWATPWGWQRQDETIMGCRTGIIIVSGSVYLVMNELPRKKWGVKQPHNIKQNRSPRSRKQVLFKPWKEKLLKSHSQFPNLTVHTVRSPGIKGRPDDLAVRPCCNTQSAFGRCQNIHSKEKNSLLCFWFMPSLRGLKLCTPGKEHIALGVGILLWPFARWPDKQAALTEALSKRTCSRQKVEECYWAIANLYSWLE